MRTLVLGTIILLTSITIVMMGYSVFTDPLFQVNNALQDAANDSGNPNLISDMENITEKTEGAWNLWPVVYIVCLIGWFVIWSQMNVNERY